MTLARKISNIWYFPCSSMLSFYVHVLFTRIIVNLFLNFIVICNGQEIDLKSDVLTVTGANCASVDTGSSVSLNTNIGFKHQASGYTLHSHDTNNNKYTPILKQQQGEYKRISHVLANDNL
ncbi:hypothetical protein RclHR1_13740002 [Rhizophagus clarus]|uniref:MIR domain-containing protein n=1 Tax=Rhizophagus clarus TaxID=94130 RepID=A0A2Z6QAV5_9GLOM|nr:hypothetical protein RclHR1_13740002 [Rhizophagus clarus]